MVGIFLFYIGILGMKWIQELEYVKIEWIWVFRFQKDNCFWFQIIGSVQDCDFLKDKFCVGDVQIQREVYEQNLSFVVFKCGQYFKLFSKEIRRVDFFNRL